MVLVAWFRLAHAQLVTAWCQTSPRTWLDLDERGLLEKIVYLGVVLRVHARRPYTKKGWLGADDFRAVVNWFPCRGITVLQKVGYHNIRLEGAKNNHDRESRTIDFLLVLKKLWWTGYDSLTVSLSKMSRWLRVTIFSICLFSKITLLISFHASDVTMELFFLKHLKEKWNYRIK